MLKAMTHGQASVTTVHAYDARGGLDKLALFLGTGQEKIPIDAAHHQLSQAVDFLVHVDRGADGRRFVSEVVEVAGFDGQRCTTNTIYTAAERRPHDGPPHPGPRREVDAGRVRRDRAGWCVVSLYGAVVGDARCGRCVADRGRLEGSAGPRAASGRCRRSMSAGSPGRAAWRWPCSPSCGR